MSEQNMTEYQSDYNSFYNYNPPKYLAILHTPIYKTVNSMIKDYK